MIEVAEVIRKDNEGRLFIRENKKTTITEILPKMVDLEPKKVEFVRQLLAGKMNFTRIHSVNLDYKYAFFKANEQDDRKAYTLLNQPREKMYLYVLNDTNMANLQDDEYEKYLEEYQDAIILATGKYENEVVFIESTSELDYKNVEDLSKSRGIKFNWCKVYMDLDVHNEMVDKKNKALQNYADMYFKYVDERNNDEYYVFVDNELVEKISKYQVKFNNGNNTDKCKVTYKKAYLWVKELEGIYKNSLIEMKKIGKESE